MFSSSFSLSNHPPIHPPTLLGRTIAHSNRLDLLYPLNPPTHPPTHPQIIKKEVKKEEAEALLKKLTEVGAKVELV